ncbi:putative c2h2 type conidiation transcription factor [Diplodia seriata]|uniref:C2H2 type master regulator of conidiophore development brlA n=2 Tax=Diplodia seriata TaxID=420778 RepID=A0A0G2EY10_9PEZI|nr:putative c2h2 type conidiation transcription factor [Diplodia seriata]
MQSAASCAHSFSSNNSSYYPNQMPPTPHSSREGLEDWMIIQQNGGAPFDHSTAQDAHRHELDDFHSEAWPNPIGFPHKPRAFEPEHQSRPGSWVMVQPHQLNPALRVSASEGDGMVLPGSRDFPSFCESQMAPHAPRQLDPPAEIYSGSLWNTQHTAPTSSYAMSNMPAQAYEPSPVAAGFNPNFEWPIQPEAAYDLPIFPTDTPGVQPEDTIVDAEDKYNEMRSDSLDDGFGGSYEEGYSSDTSPLSRYEQADEPLIKQEGDSDYRRDPKQYMTPVRKGSRRDSKVRASGITKRKMRTGNMLESFDAHHNGCHVEVKYQSNIQVDPKSGRYCSASGETKKQRCRFEGCVKTFARPEHLKRHENTHSKERPFPCVVPHCGRRFSRNDNRKAHYETHLKEALLGKKARNAPVSFEDLCRYLHQSEPEEEARKMIEKLQNPKSKLKSRD